VSGKSFFRMGVKFASARVSLDGGIELLGIKGLEPGAKPRQFVRGELLNGFLDIFGCRHKTEHSIHAGNRKEPAARIDWPTFSLEAL
jgi:hypothetical protein